MLDFLFLISAKPVVVTLATIGAVLATFSAAIEKFLIGKDSKDPAPYDGRAATKNKQPRSKASIGSWLNRLGYGIMGISVVLFIIAGFIVDLQGE
jgi:hypothetical protein